MHADSSVFRKMGAVLLLVSLHSPFILADNQESEGSRFKRGIAMLSHKIDVSKSAGEKLLIQWRSERSTGGSPSNWSRWRKENGTNHDDEDTDDDTNDDIDNMGGKGKGKGKKKTPITQAVVAAGAAVGVGTVGLGLLSYSQGVPMLKKSEEDEKKKEEEEEKEKKKKEKKKEGGEDEDEDENEKGKEKKKKGDDMDDMDNLFGDEEGGKGKGKKGKEGKEEKEDTEDKEDIFGDSEDKDDLLGNDEISDKKRKKEEGEKEDPFGEDDLDASFGEEKGDGTEKKAKKGVGADPPKDGENPFARGDEKKTAAPTEDKKGRKDAEKEGEEGGIIPHVPTYGILKTHGVEEKDNEEVSDLKDKSRSIRFVNFGEVAEPEEKAEEELKRDFDPYKAIHFQSFGEVAEPVAETNANGALAAEAPSFSDALAMMVVTPAKAQGSERSAMMRKIGGHQTQVPDLPVWKSAVGVHSGYKPLRGQVPSRAHTGSSEHEGDMGSDFFDAGEEEDVSTPNPEPSRAPRRASPKPVRAAPPPSTDHVETGASEEAIPGSTIPEAAPVARESDRGPSRTPRRASPKPVRAAPPPSTDSVEVEASEEAIPESAIPETAPVARGSDHGPSRAPRRASPKPIRTAPLPAPEEAVETIHDAPIPSTGEAEEKSAPIPHTGERTSRPTTRRPKRTAPVPTPAAAKETSAEPMAMRGEEKMAHEDEGAPMHMRGAE